MKTNYFKALRVLHTALLSGQGLFFILGFFLVIQKVLPVASSTVDRVLQVIALLLSFGSVFGGMNFFKKRLIVIQENPLPLKERAYQYRAACIVQWSMVEGASLFSIVCFLVTGNFAFAALALVLIVFFAILSPNKIKIILQLRLTSHEVALLEGMSE